MGSRKRALTFILLYNLYLVISTLYLVAMQFHIITIFPDSFKSYINTSVLRHAQAEGKIKIKFYNPRDFTADRRKTVDDRPYGGGSGMILMAEPILKAVDSIKSKLKDKKLKIVVLSAKGKYFNQPMAYRWSGKYDHLILITGRYEGIDERIKKILKVEEISIGPYVLTDGELPAMVIVSAVARLWPGVIKWGSLEEESHWLELISEEKKLERGRLLEYPHYTRPEVIVWKGKKYKVPKVLLSGHHGKIKEWRKKKMMDTRMATNLSHL